MLYGDCRRIGGLLADGREGSGESRSPHALAAVAVAEEVGAGAEGRRGESGEDLVYFSLLVSFFF